MRKKLTEDQALNEAYEHIAVAKSKLEAALRLLNIQMKLSQRRK